MSMKPIEPGCLALVICGIDSGMVVTCIEYCAPGFKFRCTNSGLVRETPVPGWITDDSDGSRSIRASYELMRIDGGEGEGVTEEQESEVTA